ncbi:hypothetical protein HBB16_05415 [Pseudonocardia sp. MCCB 268]|nr:hypothetical protein [Pseudonocardia cytotoxica]
MRGNTVARTAPTPGRPGRRDWPDLRRDRLQRPVRRADPYTGAAGVLPRPTG